MLNQMIFHQLQITKSKIVTSQLNLTKLIPLLKDHILSQINLQDRKAKAKSLENKELNLKR